jgi:hypothetical protein
MEGRPPAKRRKTPRSPVRAEHGAPNVKGYFVGMKERPPAKVADQTEKPHDYGYQRESAKNFQNVRLHSALLMEVHGILGRG